MTLDDIAGGDAASLWADILAHPGDLLGDGALDTPLVAAIARRGLTLGDAEVLGIAVRMAHFHCAALIAGDIKKPPGQRALVDCADALRAAWPSADLRLRVTILHALAAADVATPEDLARLDALLSTDAPDVLALALMIVAAVGGPERDALLARHLTHPSPLVRLMAAASLARDEGPHPLADATITALRAAYVSPPPLPRWWVFGWDDGPETADDLAERMLEAADVDVTPRPPSPLPPTS